jgi:hypothetical protein
MDLDKLAGDAHMLGELVGLAARRAGKAKITLELVPDTVQRERDLDKRKSNLVLGAGTFVLALVVFWSFSVYSNSMVETAKEKLDVVLKDMEGPAATMRKDVQRQKAAVKDVNNLVQTQQDRVQWLGIINELKQTYCSKKFWFTEVIPLVNFKPESLINTAKPRINLAPANEGIMTGDDGVVNAILVKGVWLEKSHQIAETTNEMLGRNLSEAEIKEEMSKRAEDRQLGKSKYFSSSLEYPDPKQPPPRGGAPKEIKFLEASFGGDKMFRIKPQWDESKIGSEFTIILPLKNPIVEGKK